MKNNDINSLEDFKRKYLPSTLESEKEQEEIERLGWVKYYAKKMFEKYGRLLP